MDKSQYMDAFIEEARDNLQTVNTTLLQLEEQGYSADAMKEAYRIVHTIKGTAAVMGIEPISELSHVMEDLFDVLKGRAQAPTKEQMALLFAGLDTVERILDELGASGSTTISSKEIKEKIKAMLEEAKTDRVSADRSPRAVAEARFAISGDQRNQLLDAIKEGKRLVKLTACYSLDCKLKEGRAFQLVRNLSKMGVVISSLPAINEVKDEDGEISILLATQQDDEDLLHVAKNVTSIAEARIGEYDLPVEKGAEERKAPGTEAKGEPHGAATSIRVKAKLLDQLLDLVGEIMINNIRINQIASNLKNRELKQTLQSNARLMTDLQDIVLQTRMVPVDFIFKRFPRMVRDMAVESGKNIDFVMRGNDIEIDRSLLEEIGDALVHLLRNGVDHGLESKEQRAAAGKSPTGSLLLSAFQEQGNVVITVEDDGRGIDPAKVARKAVEKGIITQEEADRMDDRAKVNLVFLPGFSTAEKVTDISGRGVGMDVVKTKIQGLGGFVKIDTVAGKGTKFTLKLPPSMSIIRAMLIEVNREKYAIPLENVRETVRVDMTKVHELASKGMFRLRDEVLPVLNVHSEFGGLAAEQGEDVPAIIVEKNDNRACLLVSRLIGQQEIVVKNVGKDLRSTGYFSGATILGDGKVAMILDVGAFV
ncbi:MAG: chemotaxis protein CheA [Methanomassiliicoccales archaeon]|nr:chemotaxis protein CheA [Methanomassiliicoccales archaeon]